MKTLSQAMILHLNSTILNFEQVTKIGELMGKTEFHSPLFRETERQLRDRCVRRLEQLRKEGLAKASDGAKDLSELCDIPIQSEHVCYDGLQIEVEEWCEPWLNAVAELHLISKQGGQLLRAAADKNIDEIFEHQARLVTLARKIHMNSEAKMILHGFMRVQNGKPDLKTLMEIVNDLPPM